MKDIVIIGAGGFGREVAWMIEDINKARKEWNILGFVDDNHDLLGKKINGYEVIGNVDWLKEQQLYVSNAVGNPIAKKNIIKYLENSKNIYPTLIHPSVIYSDNVEIGKGSIICAGTIMTVNIKIGSHVIVNLDCTIGHDVIIDDYCTVLPSVNISGAVEIEECVSIGTGTAIIQKIKIEKNSVIGAGSVVINNIPLNCTAVGAPAKPIKYNIY